MSEETVSMMSLLTLVVVLIVLVICLNTRPVPVKYAEKYRRPVRESYTPRRRVERYEGEVSTSSPGTETQLYDAGVIEDAATFASSLQSPDNVQNQISEQIEQINQQQTEEAGGFYNTNTNQYINELESQNRLNRIALQNLTLPGVRTEQDDKVTRAIMAYDFGGHVPETFESYLLRPATNGGVMRQQTVLYNNNGYGSIYAGQYLGPQRIKNPIQKVSTAAAQVVSNGVNDSIAQEGSVAVQSGEVNLSESGVKNALEGSVSVGVAGQ